MVNDVPADRSLFDLKGKTALITGATRGIGRAIAEEMGHAGARIVISGNESDACHQVSQELRASGIEAIGVVCDVSFKKEIEALVASSVASCGRIDILVCNAGVASPSGPIASATEQSWDQIMTVNLRSIWWLTSLVIPGMAKRGDGSVIIISSLSGVRGNKSIGLYGLSKAAGAQLARNLAVEWGPQGVRVNAISPGVVRTEFARAMLENEEVMRRRIALTPLRRIAEPFEIAGVAVMLASRAGGFITGQNLIVDGGTTIGDGN